MKAAVVHQVGDSRLEIRDDVRTTDPGPGDVRVRISAAGLCHSDLSAADGTVPQSMPAVLGHEGAGTVIEVGSAVTDLQVGDQVIVCWIAACGQCNDCRRGQPHLCMVFTAQAFVDPRFLIGDTPAFGMAGTGTFAEEMVVPSQGVVKVDHDIPAEVAALVGCGVMTGVGAVLNTAEVEPGSSVAVFGAGGVGISVIQGARAAGAAEIIAVDPVEKKQAWARDFGATHTTTPDGFAEVSQEVTGGEGFDYAFEVVGRSQTIRAAYDATRRGGTTVVVGAGAESEIVQFSAFELLFMEKTIKGALYGSADARRDFPKMLRMWRAGLLDLENMITGRVSLDAINDGFDDMTAGESIRQVINFG